MKLATIATDSGTTAAVIQGDQALPVEGYADVGALLRDSAGLDHARAVTEASGDGVPVEPESLRRPVLSPGAVICVGLNYRNHILEMGNELPASPTLFSKLPRALTDPYAQVQLPKVSQKVDYEAELAVVIGRGGSNIDEAEAWSHVAGFAILNDVSMRDYQTRSSQFFAGKTFQASTPWGPWVVTPDEIPSLADARISLTVNDQVRQEATLGELVFDVPTLIADLSRIIVLEPGDVISTGTPGGVGAPTGNFIKPGDTVAARIEGIGEISNTFVSHQP